MRPGQHPMIHLDLVNTLACAGAALFAGHAVQRRTPLLARHNIPAPVVGGLLVALAVTGLRVFGHRAIAFDTTLQGPLMIAFFTAIGFNASVPLLRTGGPAVALFLALATAVGIVQNVVGVSVARLLGVPPLLGVIAGSVTLMGGPATGLAFAPLFEQAGVKGAATLAVASAMVGIMAGGVVGGPIGTWLIERRRLRPGTTERTHEPTPAQGIVHRLEPPDPVPATAIANEEPVGHALLKGVVTIAATMAAGSWISAFLTSLGLTLPAYIGAMLAAAALRNLDDATGLVRLPHRRLDELGNAALALFIAMALMTLKLWELAGLALPLAAILAVQVAVTAALAVWPTFRLMGRSYEAAVMSSGFCGFMLGTTANAMANLGALTERYGPAPRAYLVVPMVGAFFIDFTNALLITACLNLWR
jgi:glutamate:Na+ symporter, ESS family